MVGPALRHVALLVTLAMPAWAQPADMVLRNGIVHTVDGGSRTVAAVAIRGGRFVVVGNDAAAMAQAGPGTEVVDLGGRTMVPGLIDTHLHMSFAALNRPAVALLDARSVADVQGAIAARVARTPPGQWVLASSGWHESLLVPKGRLPTRHRA